MACVRPFIARTANDFLLFSASNKILGPNPPKREAYPGRWRHDPAMRLQTVRLKEFLVNATATKVHIRDLRCSRRRRFCTAGNAVVVLSLTGAGSLSARFPWTGRHGHRWPHERTRTTVRWRETARPQNFRRARGNCPNRCTCTENDCRAEIATERRMENKGRP